MTDRILSKRFDDGILFLRKAREQENEEKLYSRWIQGYQMHISYQDFKKEAINNARVIKEKSEDEILDKVKKIINHKE